MTSKNIQVLFVYFCYEERQLNELSLVGDVSFTIVYKAAINCG